MERGIDEKYLFFYESWPISGATSFDTPARWDLRRSGIVCRDSVCYHTLLWRYVPNVVAWSVWHLRDVDVKRWKSNDEVLYFILSNSDRDEYWHLI